MKAIYFEVGIKVINYKGRPSDSIRSYIAYQDKPYLCETYGPHNFHFLPDNSQLLDRTYIIAKEEFVENTFDILYIDIVC